MLVSSCTKKISLGALDDCWVTFPVSPPSVLISALCEQRAQCSHLGLKFVLWNLFIGIGTEAGKQTYKQTYWRLLTQSVCIEVCIFPYMLYGLITSFFFFFSSWKGNLKKGGGETNTLYYLMGFWKMSNQNFKIIQIAQERKRSKKLLSRICMCKVSVALRHLWDLWRGRQYYYLKS